MVNAMLVVSRFSAPVLTLSQNVYTIIVAALER
jgi:hypothetical protein